MTVRSTALSALLIIGGLVMPLGAQQPAAPAASSEDIDVSKLPLNLNRLQSKLQASVQREEQSGPHIRFNIDVLGTAPRLKLLSPEDNLRDGPVPYGAPTHRDMMNYATPMEFRAPVMDFNSLMRWIQSKVGKS
jgi:hypothetical protein